MKAYLDPETYEPLDGLDVVESPWGDSCSFTGMNLETRDTDDSEFVLGPDGVWYEFFEDWEMYELIDDYGPSGPGDYLAFFPLVKGEDLKNYDNVFP